MREAIQRSEKHIIDVALGRVRLGLSPDQIDEYLAEEKRRVEKMRKWFLGQ